MIYGCAAAPHGYNIDDHYGIFNYELPDGWKGWCLGGTSLLAQ